MIQQWFKKIPRFSSPTDFFKNMPPKLIDIIAFIGLALFFLFPFIISLRTLYHLSFDMKVFDCMFLLDSIVFPIVGACSAMNIVFTLGKMRYAKRPVRVEARKNPVFIIFGLLLVWMCVNFFIFRPVQGGLFNGVSLQHESFSLNLEYYLGFFMLGFFLTDHRLKLLLLRLLVCVSVFVAPCAEYFWRHVTASSVYDWYPMLDAVFTNSNYYGYFLCMVISLCAGLLVAEERIGWRVFYIFALLLNTATLSDNRTMGAWIAAFCACVFLIIVCRIRDGVWNRWALAALGLYVAALVITGLLNGMLFMKFGKLFSGVSAVLTDPNSQAAQSAGTNRWGVWQRYLDLIAHNPIFGIGMEGIYVYQLLAYVGSQRPHNEYLQYAVFYGIPAVILYTMGVVGVFLRAFLRRATLDNVTLAALTSAMAYVVSACFGVTVYNTTPFFFIMLGLGYVAASQEKSRNARTY